MTNHKFFLTAASLAILSGCSTVSDIFKESEDPPLEGKRISVLELQKSLEPDTKAQNSLALPETWNNEFWPQAGGYPNHSMQNPALGPELQEAWSADIGQGGSRELPLTAQPVAAAGLVFTLDTDARLSAFNAANGQLQWEQNVANPQEDDPVISGGIAFSSNTLYVTNGFDELLAVNPASGAIIWRAKLPAPSRAAPTAINGRVFVATLDNRLIACDGSTGKILWDYVGISETAGLLGAASPGANNAITVPVFSSGEITALRVENGSVAWSDNLSNVRQYGIGLESLSDIKAMPVLDKGLVIGFSFAGKIAAIDEATGKRVWQRDIGGSQTPWVSGNGIYVVSSDNQVIALTRDTGAIAWVKQLTRYEDEKNHEDPIAWTGPIMAGGRLILASSTGNVVEIDPRNGEIFKSWSVKKPIAAPPLVAKGTLYLLADDGTLMAFR